jgi:hypothetical protein
MLTNPRLQATPTREVITPEAPAPQACLTQKYTGSSMLPPLPPLREGGREGGLTGAHRSLASQPSPLDEQN